MFTNLFTISAQDIKYKTSINIYVLTIVGDSIPHKQIRKIIKAGNTSFAVILPIAWLRYFDLGYGDKVEVISNGSVEIKPYKMGE